jgi:sirohydrochlorin cobaltochelatase
MSLADELDRLLPRGTRLTFGELALSRCEEGAFEARPLADVARSGGLAEVSTVRELRDLAKYDAEGSYRPLKTAPGLVSGWRTVTSSPAEFLKRLDAVYPGLFATWISYQRGETLPVALRQTLNRQTGMYRFAGTITPEMGAEIKRDLCGAGCLRHVTWPIEEGDAPCPPEVPSEALPLLCTEACTFAVSRARELAKAAHDARTASAGTGD